MSKKQLRSVRKTSVNQFGQVELVNPYSGASDNGKPKAKKAAPKKSAAKKAPSKKATAKTAPAKKSGATKAAKAEDAEA